MLTGVYTSWRTKTKTIFVLALQCISVIAFVLTLLAPRTEEMLINKQFEGHSVRDARTH